MQPHDASDYLLSGRNLKVYYPVTAGVMRKVVGHVKSLDGVDFDLPSGKVLGIVGETGSGKTTLGRAVLQLVKLTAGEVRFASKDVSTFDRAALKNFRREAQ